MAPRHRLSLQHYNQEDDEARRERGSNEPDRRLLALNLLRFASSDASVSVRMVDRGDERYMGPARAIPTRQTTCC